MFRSLMASLVVAVGVCCFASNLFAQLGRYDPYAKPVDDLPPVSSDGTLHWPTYFRSAALEARYQNLWRMGACGGTNKSITVPVEKNKLSIDALPETSVAGRVLQVKPDSLMVLQADGKPAMIITHPAGVSHIEVTGDVPARLLKPGMLVRFLGEIDPQGHGVAPVDAVDVLSNAGDFAPPAAEPGHRVNVIGVVKSLHGKTLVVQTATGELRKLTFLLADEATAHLQTTELKYCGVGDQVAAKGRLYSVAGGKPERCVFASDVEVAKR
ncbi:hypothetical protein [Blastopirellula retiformator]|uniref:Uncharacterized protein n=1 Tax=Blastopirellula retiformator TaxID=2527970 RepID=A0A5C5V8P3_9BACT|nr:hypothetical protein [Blastopirellula retiformator]TWT34956.1 hypothetical protein Enr8_23720 [Blastopirellula retiformator]